MKRKVIKMLLIMMLCFVGCGNTDDSNDKDTDIQNVQNNTNVSEDNGNNTLNIEVSLETLEAAEETSEDQFQYFENKNGTYTISEYLGSDTIVVIPEEISGIAVTDISSSVFINNETIEGIRIGNNIEELDENQFTNCSALKYIILGENVKSVGKLCFNGCILLEKIQLNDALETIEFAAFVTLGDNLKEIRIPENISNLEVAFVPPTVVYVKEGSYAAEWVVDFVEKNPADAFEYVIE